MPQILVPSARLVRWVENFEARHGSAVLSVEAGALHGRAVDGSWFAADLPFAASYAGPAVTARFAGAAEIPGDWGVLLVRKGGFAVARMSGEATQARKVGQRHVQGRTKAGGQSQQRFARRRDNQARAAYEAAAGHAARILEGLTGPVVAGGDRAAVAEVLADPRLAGASVVEPWLAVPDPRGAVLDQAVRDAAAVRIAVRNAGDEADTTR